MEAELFGACNSKKDSKGQYRHDIFLNPSSLPIELHADAPRLRLGTLLHEMIHAFLSEYVCIACTTTQQNISDDFSNGHGRAWHRLAVAVEKAASELLECGEVDLGRLMTLHRYLAPMYTASIRDPFDRMENETAYNPSFHDLQEFGFLDGELIGLKALSSGQSSIGQTDTEAGSGTDFFSQEAVKAVYELSYQCIWLRKRLCVRRAMKNLYDVVVVVSNRYFLPGNAD